jgi:phosphoribosylanthranilate isomerase
LTVRVKICGARTAEQALVAADAGADFIGLVLTKSPRRLDAEEAAEIVRALGTPLRELEQESPPALFRAESDDLGSWFGHGAAALDRLLERKRPLTVGVFADNDPDEVNELADECGLDLIQLSGGEPWSACLLANRQVIRAVHVDAAETAEQTLTRMQTGSAMAVLLDSAHATLRGGTGRSHDWATAAAVAKTVPVWLGGGLTPHNVAEAVKTVRPWCVDVSSGVETDGVKDASKVRAFIRAAKGAG